jgi:hypothetical protein
MYGKYQSPSLLIGSPINPCMRIFEHHWLKIAPNHPPDQIVLFLSSHGMYSSYLANLNLALKGSVFSIEVKEPLNRYQYLQNDVAMESG